MNTKYSKNVGSSIGVLLFVVAIIGLIAFLFLGLNEGDSPDDQTPATSTQNELISVDTPTDGDEISSPVTISGEARGTWYFGADFPVEVVDNAGNSLGMAPATANGNWMTDNFVPFTGEIEFDASAAETADGRVIFHRSNPSGLAENDDSVEIPVTFEDDEAAASMTVQVFWSDDAAAVAGDCSIVQSFEREIPQTQGVGQAAIAALLEGPTDQEVDDGFSSNIPNGVSLNSLRIESRIAYADFSSELNDIGGSCRVQAITAQIQETLQQFSTIDNVEISVNGETEAVLQP
jgi:hypothetical protein